MQNGDGVAEPDALFDEVIDGEDDVDDVSESIAVLDDVLVIKQEILLDVVLKIETETVLNDVKEVVLVADMVRVADDNIVFEIVCEEDTV